MPISFRPTIKCNDFFFFFFNDTATTEIYTLSLHDALPIRRGTASNSFAVTPITRWSNVERTWLPSRSEEHTSELQSRPHLVCRLLLEKKKQTTILLFFSIKKKKTKKT